MNRTILARTVSIVGHPVVLLFAAALIAATSRGASARQLWLVAGTLVMLSAIALGYSWFQVRAGRWAHIDASVREERASLNFVLASALLLSALLSWLSNRQPALPLALALCGALVVVAFLTGRWVKVSLHTAFATFATILVWSIKPAFYAGVAMTAAVVWSRLVLRRHVAADIVSGLLLGAAAGVAYLYTSV